MVKESERAIDEELYHTGSYIWHLVNSISQEDAAKIANWHLKQLEAVKREAKEDTLRKLYMPAQVLMGNAGLGMHTIKSILNEVYRRIRLTDEEWEKEVAESHAQLAKPEEKEESR